MNKSVVILFSVFVSLIFLSNKGGRNQATTGAPFENSAPACANCHSGGSYDPKIDVVLKDASNTEVSSYVADQEYTIEMKISSTGNPVNYGFQAVIVDKDAMQAGSFTTLGDKVRKLTLANRTYLTQVSPRADGIFTAKWKAPASDTSIVYIAGLATNNNSGTGGDKSKFTSIKLNKSGLSATSEPNLKSVSLLQSNIVSNELNFIKEVDRFSLYDMNGNVILKNENDKNISQIPAGIYIVNYKNNGKDFSERIMKF
jgi:hypothetical protein